MSAPQRFTQVDAFTERPFGGNPAAVCILPVARTESWMQHVAREMNLAETAFLVPASGGYDLRWFTPVVEVDLCGHATVASAHVLWEEGHLQPGQTAVFFTRSGELSAARRNGLIWLDFPATPEREVDGIAEMQRSLGAEIRYMGRTAFDYLVEVESAAVLRSITPNLGALTRLPVRGVIVTARSDTGEHDFLSRFFAPAAGVPEDPVTGSAHCGLGPFWAARLGRNDLTGYQASERGGTVRLRVEGDRVHLGGHAVTVLRGELLY